MSYVKEFARFESISVAEEPTLTMVVLPIVRDRLNSHPTDFPEDPIFTDLQGGIIARGEETDALPNKSLGALLVRECVRYAEVALACEGVRITNRSNHVVGTILPEHFDNTFLMHYYRHSVPDKQLNRGLTVLKMAADYADASRLKTIADRHETLLGDVFTYGYDFRRQLMGAREPGTDMTLLARNGKLSRLVLL